MDLIENKNGHVVFSDYLDNEPNQTLSPSVATDYLYELVKVLSQLHKINIYHNDIKEDNILIDKNKNLWLIDFGFSVIADPLIGFVKPQKYVGTLVYTNRKSSLVDLIDLEKKDVYALGMTYFFMLQSFSVLPEQYLAGVGTSKYVLDFEWMSTIKSPLKNIHMNLLRMMLDDDFTKRSTMKEILEALEDNKINEKNLIYLEDDDLLTYSDQEWRPIVQIQDKILERVIPKVQTALPKMPIANDENVNFKLILNDPLEIRPS